MNKDLKDNIIIILLVYVAIMITISVFKNGNSNAATYANGDKHPNKSTLNKPTAINGLNKEVSNSIIDNNRPIPDPILDKPKTSISFKNTDYDFGNIKQDSQHKHIFYFNNTGNNPLIIANAKPSCGCTVANYPKQPIAPGARSKIVIIYTPGKQEGSQHKTVTITANSEPPTTVLNIAANVEK